MKNLSSNSPLFPGVRELLFELSNKKIAIAIVTDLNSHIQMRKLTYFQLQETFDAFVTSEEVGADKPDPKNFYLVLNKLGMNVDNNIWMVGDNPRTDIIGGRSIGAVTFQRINNNDEMGDGEFMPDFTFTKFTDSKFSYKNYRLIQSSKSSKISV